MDYIRLFVGRDPAETVGYHVFIESVLRRTDPNKIIISSIAGDKGDASNVFGKARFLVPYMCNFNGWAIFADGSDMLMRADIKELWDLRETGYDVMVAPHCYSTKHPVKFLGQPNDDYPRKNQSSLMLMYCGGYPWRKITPEYVKQATSSHLHRFEFLKEDRIGELPKEYNWLVSEYPYNPEAKLAHFTIGLPCWPSYKNCDYADEWRQELRQVNHFQQWGVEAYDDSPLVSER
jgi:hypothetical protein